jgi:peroxiredoxin
MKLTRVLGLWLISSLVVFGAVMPADTQDTVTPLAVGSAAPTAMVKTAAGEAVDLGELVRAKPTILIFYRGGWCPYCNTHLAELQTIEPELMTLGYQIVAVSPDRPEAMPPTTEKNHLSYRLLSDRQMNASAAYGIAFTVPDEIRTKYAKWNIDLAPVPADESLRWLPVPSVFVIGGDGTVRFVHSNPDYKVRMETTTLLASAKAATGVTD